MIAEDDPLTRENVRARLSRAGYDTVTARNGVECLHQLSSERPDALILDLQMPNLDGFAVLETFNGEMPDRLPPTMIVTARKSPEDVSRAIALGAKDYLLKSDMPQQLLSRVARLLRPPAPDAA